MGAAGMCGELNQGNQVGPLGLKPHQKILGPIAALEALRHPKSKTEHDRGLEAIST
jgi:hypothetical protein